MPGPLAQLVTSYVSYIMQCPEEGCDTEKQIVQAVSVVTLQFQGAKLTVEALLER